MRQKTLEMVKSALGSSQSELYDLAAVWFWSLDPSYDDYLFIVGDFDTLYHFNREEFLERKKEQTKNTKKSKNEEGAN